MRSLIGHAVLFVPIAYLVMIVYVAPHADDASTVARLAVKKTGKVVFWTVVIILAMQALQFVFLP